MRDTKWILRDGAPVPCQDIHEWGQWFSQAAKTGEWIVAQTFLVGRPGTYGIRISTVFLGIDHQIIEGGPPILWETMIFPKDPDSPLHNWQQRYPSREKAEAGHLNAVALATTTINSPVKGGTP